ncbi:hypothetical protein PIB30_075461 [Stylosanthes scabra]|uniref:Uncharacterized protein n=1 Tax=Stylosanthes scabra TaxID=79078 RepID=A0ABU6TQR5_9FABA|nr:hypothetical protein [Stylosanthes scabra]
MFGDHNPVGIQRRVAAFSAARRNRTSRPPLDTMSCSKVKCRNIDEARVQCAHSCSASGGKYVEHNQFRDPVFGSGRRE